MEDLELEDVLKVGYRGVKCVESGGPEPVWVARAAASSPPSTSSKVLTEVGAAKKQSFEDED